MNPGDRAIYRVLLVLFPSRVLRHTPLSIKKLLNRWLKHRGDPGDRA